VRAIGKDDTALLANGQDGANQMLVESHAPGNAVHDDADALFAHRLIIAFI
jgi:hypothetical protein